MVVVLRGSRSRDIWRWTSLAECVSLALCLGRCGRGTASHSPAVDSDGPTPNTALPLLTYVSSHMMPVCSSQKNTQTWPLHSQLLQSNTGGWCLSPLTRLPVSLYLCSHCTLEYTYIILLSHETWKTGLGHVPCMCLIESLLFLHLMISLKKMNCTNVSVFLQFLTDRILKAARVVYSALVERNPGLIRDRKYHLKTHRCN